MQEACSPLPTGWQCSTGEDIMECHKRGRTLIPSNSFCSVKGHLILKRKMWTVQVCKWNPDFLHLAITLQDRYFSFAILFLHKIKFHVNFKTFKHPKSIVFSFSSFSSLPCVPFIFQIFTHALHKLSRTEVINAMLSLSYVYTWCIFKLPHEITSLFYVLMHAYFSFPSHFYHMIPGPSSRLSVWIILYVILLK